METIFAQATPPGRSGVAVIRISGPQATQALSHFGCGPALPAPRKAVYHSFTLAGEIVDQGLILYFPAPHSFTGEDCIEFQLHGSIAVLRRVLAELSTLPEFRLAEAGEFARRAFLNGKLDLTAAEGLVDLIEAETEAQRQQAARTAQGHASIFYQNLRSAIIQPLALLEAYIDFPEEDIPESITQEIHTKVSEVTRAITTQLALFKHAEKIREGYTVVILGAPNAGKSTLLNALAGRDVAIISERAGTTRDMIEVHLDLGGLPVTLIDTAGLRETTDEIESEGIRRALTKAENADMKLVLFDATSSLDAPTLALLDSQSLLVFTKSDLANVLPPLPPTLTVLGKILVSAHAPETLNAVTSAIEKHLAESARQQETPFVTRQRQHDHLVLATTYLGRFAQEWSLELQCEHLRLAAVEIGKITGLIQVDELLDVIFSSFCIGK